jgi:hypothetical protein
VQCGRSGPVTFARRLKDPLPQPPYDRLLGPPIDAVPIEALALRSVHCRQHRRVRDGETVSGHRVQLALRFPACSSWLQGLTCLTSAPFRGRAPGPVSGQLYATIGEGADTRRCAFLSPFGHRHSLLGASCPARGFRPPYGRPTAPPNGDTDPSEVSTFRIARDPAGRRGLSWPHGWRRAKRGITEVRRCARPAAQNTEVPAVQTAAVGTDSFMCASGFGFLGGIMTRCTMPTPSG